jgi:cupin 2 domain-containing protein
MTTVRRGRLFDESSAPPVGEHVEELVSCDGVVVEQILSGSLPAPADFRQDHDEWVVVLAGRAVLEMQGERIELRHGDWVFIPTGTLHRVEWTEPGTNWLAVHMSRGGTV